MKRSHHGKQLALPMAGIAHKHRLRWSVEDDKIIMSFWDEPLEELAKALGRTNYAVLARKAHLEYILHVR